jgi:hypothetical protein
VSSTLKMEILMNKENKSIEEKFFKIYRKYVQRYKHRDTNQMCCMWSIANPPDEIYECDQIYNIEEEFNISLTEDDALSLYNMHFEEAVQFIEMKCKVI